MDKSAIKSALHSISALMYYASSAEYLEQDQIEELSASLRVISVARDEDRFFRGRASIIVGSVRSSGVFATPPRKANGYESIMKDCRTLEQYLETARD
jgi:hypothetical protein